MTARPRLSRRLAPSLPGRLPVLLPALLGLALGVLALGPALLPGFVLRYDLVFVPDPPFVLPGSGFPRAVPSDQVAALLSSVLPSPLVEKGLLLAIFVLAASGAAALVPSGRTVPRLAAAVFYAWNIYLAQRLLLGQWALLLGVAGLPWAVKAVAARPFSVVRLAVALLPAAVGGFQAMLVSALTVLPVALLLRGWRAVWAVGVMVVLSLPWLVPALASPAVTDPAGVDAFAARADGPFGVVGSLLSLGGIWNAQAGVPGQDGWWLATARLTLALVALTGFAALRRHPREEGSPFMKGTPPMKRLPSGEGSPPKRGQRPSWWAGLAVAAVVGLGVAVVGALWPAVPKGLIGLWSGFGPLRDGQLYLAPLVLAAAMGFAALVPRAGAMALAVPLLVLPTFALGAFGSMAAVDYPDDWRQVQRIVNDDPTPGALLSLPWGAHRAFAWNGGRIMLDPATKLFARQVIWNDSLLVGRSDGTRLTVRGEDPLSGRIGAAMATGHLAEALDAAGVRYVLVVENENMFRSMLPTWDPIFEGREVLLLRR
ncbi:hypothetical protein ACIBG8_22500 [Nonomuraea sp. NPDC050556]|uniref:hypothetical protein n=1 Tax=Nonomuraea sp. NPDC050556 TaxID=3364369 RepID=UPI0037AA9273